MVKVVAGPGRGIHSFIHSFMHNISVHKRLPGVGCSMGSCDGGYELGPKNDSHWFSYQSFFIQRFPLLWLCDCCFFFVFCVIPFYY